MIFDTDVLIWASRGNPKAAHAIDRARERAISIVSFMELMQGARSKIEARKIKQSLRELGFTVLPLTESIGATAATLIEQHALSHGIQVADALIAATALDAGESLCTANARHFRPIHALSVTAFRP